MHGSRAEARSGPTGRRADSRGPEEVAYMRTVVELLIIGVSSGVGASAGYAFGGPWWAAVGGALCSACAAITVSVMKDYFGE